MRKTWVTVIIIVIIVIIGLWVWSAHSGSNTQSTYTTATSDQNEAPMIPATSTPEASSSSSALSAPAVVTVATDPKLGSYLVAANGMTLYTYSPDKPNQSVCVSTCAANWPPYVVSGTLVAGNGVTGTLATYTRADGTTQLTYNGQPVYSYIRDKKAGDTLGQGVGGVWYVAKP